MCDGLAARHLRLCTFLIDVDPLLVTGRLREFIDAILGHLNPLADADLRTNCGLELFKSVEYPHSFDPRSRLRASSLGPCRERRDRPQLPPEPPQRLRLARSPAGSPCRRGK